MRLVILSQNFRRNHREIFAKLYREVLRPDAICIVIGLTLKVGKLDLDFGKISLFLRPQKKSPSPKKSQTLQSKNEGDTAANFWKIN